MLQFVQHGEAGGGVGEAGHHLADVRLQLEVLL
jgi:hypothetical protein